MNRRILIIGHLPAEFHVPVNYKIYKFNLDGISAKKINNLEKKIKNNEVKLAIIVFSEYLCSFIKENTDIELFKKTISLTQPLRRIILIKDTFLTEEFTVYDFKRQREIGIKEIDNIIEEMKLTISELNIVNLQKVKELDTKQVLNYENSEFLYNLSDYQSEVGRIFNEQKKMESWLRTYMEYKKNLLDLVSKKDLIGSLQIVADELKDEKVEFKFYKDIQPLLNEELIDALKDELFNFYIKHDNFYSQEFDDFIQLFEKYLRSIEEVDINLDVQKTKEGTLYIIRYLNKDLVNYNIGTAIENFGTFLDLCNNSPEDALEILKSKFNEPSKALEILQSMSKKYKRLLLDLQQQKEKIQLLIKQEVQSQFLELNIAQTPLSMISSDNGMGSLMNFYNPIVSNKEFMRKRYNENEIELIALLEKYGSPNDVVTIKSSIDKINDEEIVIPEKNRSLFNMKKMSKKVGKMVLDNSEKITVDLLTKYLEQKMF